MQLKKAKDKRANNTRPMYEDRSLIKAPVTIYIPQYLIDKMGGRKVIQGILKEVAESL